jgi:AAA+ superfamily predicted ATPase
VTWERQSFEVVTLTLRQDCNTDDITFIVADDFEAAQRFFLAVCDWCATVRGEVLVFEEGQFTRSQQLHESIGKATFDDLILAPTLLEAMRDDVRRFVASRELYAQYKVPWKRGLLMLGPPGNGKTHTLRALINETKWPCLYVKAFRSRHGSAEEGIATVFTRARRAAPCVVVLEDLDCLIDESNRSVLLNELDGFAQNQGLLVVASTNHPEKLDRSLLDRPSRFDRKFHFPLPGAEERRRYLARWQLGVEVALRLSERGLGALVEGTHGFTFAYLKELCFGAMLAFMEAPAVCRMDEVAEQVMLALKGEMSSARKMLPPLPDSERRISLS